MPHEQRKKTHTLKSQLYKSPVYLPVFQETLSLLALITKPQPLALALKAQAYAARMPDEAQAQAHVWIWAKKAGGLLCHEAGLKG